MPYNQSDGGDSIMLLNNLAGIGETALTMGSGMIAEPVSGILGLASLPFGADVATKVIQGTQEGLTYQPRTQSGQESLQSVGEILAPVSEGFEAGSRYLGDTAYDLTGSPALATMAYSTPTALLEALGLSGARSLGKAGKLGQQYEMGNVPTRSLGNQEGIFAGIKSKTADLDALEKAKQMAEQGRPEQMIYKETGWFNDGGDWKYEIDDSKARLGSDIWADINQKETDYYNQIAYDNEKLDRYSDKLEAMVETGELNPADVPEMVKAKAIRFKNKQQPMLDEIDKLKDTSTTGYQLGGLSRVLHHPELFKAYPNMENLGTNIRATPEELGGAYGVYKPSTDQIKVLADRDNPEKLSTLLHEGQHAIQERENFTRGGTNEPEFTDRVKEKVQTRANFDNRRFENWQETNQDLIQNKAKASQDYGDAIAFNDYQKAIEYANSPSPTGIQRHILGLDGWLHSDRIRNHPDPEIRERSNEIYRYSYTSPKKHRPKHERGEWLRNYSFMLGGLIRDAVGDEVIKGLKADPRQTKSIIKANERAIDKANAELAPMRELQQTARASKNLDEATKYKSPYRVYEALGGEVEARNVQARQNMTPQERAGSFPRYTEDVPHQEKINIDWQTLRDANY